MEGVPVKRGKWKNGESFISITETRKLGSKMEWPYGMNGGRDISGQSVVNVSDR